MMASRLRPHHIRLAATADRSAKATYRRWVQAAGQPASSPPGTRKARLRTLAVLAAACVLPVLAIPASASADDQTAKKLDITMQAQENDNWCWAASGNTIAAFFGHSYTQNQFCDMAFGNPVGDICPNDQATLENDQNAFSQIGMTPGTYVSGPLDFSTLTGEIDAGRPVETRIEWSSGGGHMEVLYGYDPGQNLVYWGNPWPDSNRYNWESYDYYVSNSEFSWTDSLDGIGA